MINNKYIAIFFIFLLSLSATNVLGLGGDDGGDDGVGGADGGQPGLGGADGGQPGLGGADGGSSGGSSEGEAVAAAVNNAPTLSVGNKQVNENSLLQFSISGSDQDGDSLSYSASNLPSGASFSGQTFSWTPNFDQAGSFSVTFTVSDGEDSASSTITITVINTNRAPVLSGLTDQSVDEDNSLSNVFDLDNFASDPDGNSLSFTRSSNNVVITIDSNNQVSLFPNSNFNGQETITFTVSDGSLTDTDSITLTVNAVNDIPVLNIPDQTFDEDNVKTFDLDDFLTDPDIATNNDVITFSITGNSQISVTISPSNLVTLTPSANFNGQETITFTATDLAGTSDSDAVLVTVNAVNDNPILDFLGLSFVLSGSGVPERDLDLDNFTTDVDIATNNDVITYTSEENSVFSVAIQNSVATVKAVNAKFTTNLGTLFDGKLFDRVTEKIKFRATDSFAASDTDELTITIGNAPHAIISYNELKVREEQVFELSAERSFDLDGQIVSYLWDLGDGTTSSEIKLQHNYSNEGSFTVTLTVTDDDGLSDSQSIKFTVGDKLTKQHKFAIATKIYGYETYSPGDQYENYLKIVNVGNLKEKGIQIKVIVPDLEVEEVLTSSFNLDPYQTRWVSVIFDIPEDATKNEYLAKITLDGRKSDAFGYLTFSVD